VVDDGPSLSELPSFLAQLGAAMNAAGEPVHSVQARLTVAARAYGSHDARISAFPTYMMVSMGRGEPVTVELTTSLSGSPRLDQIAALDRLVEEAQRGAVAPTGGLRRLDAIGAMPALFGPAAQVVGYAVLTLGICLTCTPPLVTCRRRQSSGPSSASSGRSAAGRPHSRS
jgi:uncharacterized membrane protein YjjP (DUF1212 family)